MGYRYVVLGAGRQGLALAYDLARRAEAERVTLADADPDRARSAAGRCAALLPDSACELAARQCDVSRPEQVAPTIAGADVVVSAVPYRFNPPLTAAAIAARASFCDLGGNTATVREQLRQHAQALAAGVSVVPDCGLAPGLGNHLAAHGIASLDQPQDVHIRCGGLPERPVGPLGYKLLFSFEGLLNEYSGRAEFLRDGRLVEVAALSELEELDFGPPLGRCEAAVTSGGTSTCPASYAGRLRSYDYKTVRYPGHFAIMRALFALGCFAESLELPDGTTVAPRNVMRRLMEQRLAQPGLRDLVVLRVTVSGRHAGRKRTLRYDLLERYDELTGLTAMQRATAFPAALVAHMQARRLISPGARPAELALPAQQFFAELPQHDIRVSVRAQPAPGGRCRRPPRGGSAGAATSSGPT